MLKADDRGPKPSVDGVLDNAYQEYGVRLKMCEKKQGSKPTVATTVSLACDEQNLYIFFNCDEPKMEQLRTDRDSGVWADDCVDIFLDREGDESKYTHLILRAAGVRYDSRRDIEKKWNPECEAVVLRGAKFWSVELRIPFEILGGVPKPAETWQMNFCRQRRPIGKELSAWSATFGAFEDPNRYGFVQFNSPDQGL